MIDCVHSKCLGAVANYSLQPTHPVPRAVMPVASGSHSLLSGKGVIGYHVLCSGSVATVMPLLGPVCAAELQRFGRLEPISFQGGHA